MLFKTIISVSQLAKNLDKADWLILDCRGKYLGEKKSYSNFISSHVPNAFYCCFSEDCTSDTSNNHSKLNASDPNMMIDNLKTSGFNQSSQIIIYDDTGSSFTDNLWLQFRSLGCQNVAVLQGGFNEWVAHEMPITKSAVPA